MSTKVKISEFLAYFEPHAVITNSKAPTPPPANQWGYTMGGDGRVADESYLTKRAKSSYPDSWSSYLERTRKWIGRQVFDCNAMAEAFYKLKTGKSIDTKARYNYSGWCGKKSSTASDKQLTGIPQMPGVAVFSGSSAAKITHVGYLLKKYGSGRLDWYVIEARGADYGVVITKLTERSWAWWGVMDKHFIYDLDENGLKADVGSGSTAEKGGTTMPMTAKDFTAKLTDIAKNYKTLYVMGCFGAPMTAANKTRYCNNHSYNKQAARTAMIKAASEDTFGFDCVCLIKGVLWGWSGDKSKTYGGAGYAINGVPDIGADTMITKCSGVSTTGWSDMEIGEALWCSGHIGVYIGDGLAVECSPRWENKVQITAVKNIGTKSGYNARQWTKHGRLPYITYDGSSDVSGGNSGVTEDVKPSTSLGFAIGDTVNFTGSKHYASSNANNAKACKPGEAKVTAIAKSGKHPYHLIKVSGKGSTVYGWVDADTVESLTPAIAVGDKVKVKDGAKTYTGGSLASFVYKTTYLVRQIDGDRVVIAPKSTGAVTAAVKLSDLIKQ